MLGIEDIAFYIAENRESNFGKVFDGKPIDEKFLKEKVGIESIAVKDKDTSISDMCMKAYEALIEKNPINIKDVGCIILCSNSGDYISPHTSAVLQHRLGASTTCAAFDIKLGCNGYIYSLDILISFMEKNKFKKALLFTCDSLTNVVDKTDKSTSILFGDGATVSIISDNPKYIINNATYHTYGEFADIVTRSLDNKLYMDGKSVFFYALKYIPKAVKENMELNNIDKKTVDLFVFHQANKYMIETIASVSNVDFSKVPIDIKDYGNTGQSSIPIVLAKNFNKGYELIYLAAIGDGLSIAAIPLRKYK